jgi:outer membrane scaffolding protein for murein synthesis (MipA/OmpV family)
MQFTRSLGTPRIRFIAWCLFGAAVLAMAGEAEAQTPSPLGEWQYSAGVVLKRRFDPDPPHWEALLGVGAIALPRYEGSNDYFVEPGPVIDIRYRDLAFFSTGEGLGINLLHTTTYRAGIALTYDLGRNEGDYYRLGQSNLSAAAAPKIFGEYVIFPVILRADVRHNIGGVGGWIGDVSAYMPVAGNDTFFVFAGATVTIANTTYFQNDFGVNAPEARGSNLPLYVPGGGVKSAGIGTNMTYIFHKHWFLNGVFAATELLGPAADSPNTESKLQGAVSFNIAYDFR